MAENPLKVIAILEILHFVVHQSKKGIKKYYEANPDALKISEVKFFNPYESEKYRRKNFKGSIRTIESEKWLNWPVIYMYVNINKIHNRSITIPWNFRKDVFLFSAAEPKNDCHSMIVILKNFSWPLTQPASWMRRQCRIKGMIHFAWMFNANGTVIFNT